MDLLRFVLWVMLVYANPTAIEFSTPRYIDGVELSVAC
jgi:hypothetical protein